MSLTQAYRLSKDDISTSMGQSGPYQDSYGFKKIGNQFFWYFWLLLCSGLRTRIECPNYEVVRIVQPVFQPRTVANLSLDFGCPHSLFKPNDKVFMSSTRDDINISWTRYDMNTTYGYERSTDKRGTNSAVLVITLPCLQHKGRFLPGQNTRRIDQYPVARSATACGTNM